MANKLQEFKIRDEAHEFQAKVIADGTAPFACCTEHVNRGDTVIVWDETPAPADVERAEKEPRLP